jgi:NB-ARC domain-containing protein/tetratricopeptide repeat protein
MRRADRRSTDAGLTTASVQPSAAANTMRDSSGIAVQVGSSRWIEVHNHAPAEMAVTRRSAGRPPPCADAFQDRQVLHELISALATEHTATLSGMGSKLRMRAGSAVLQGLGGVGKTQLAAAYAHTMRVTGNIEVLVWVDATARDAILAGMARAATAVLGVDGHDLPRAAGQLMDWLHSTEQRWLLVLDDLRDPRDLHGFWPPRSPCGQVVMTTRLRDPALRTDGTRVIEVEPFTLDEATTFMTQRLRGQADGAAGLAEAMGCLPLALAHAAAFIEYRRDLTCATYQELFEDRRRMLSSLRPRCLPDGHRETIATTWSLSIEHANRLSPLARPLLRLAALLDPNGIPERLFTNAQTYLRITTGLAASTAQVRDALSCLHRFSLITYDPRAPDQAVRMHAMVQYVVRETLRGRRRARPARAAAAALVQVWPGVERDLVVTAVLRANATELQKWAGAFLWRRPAHAVLFRVGNSFGDCGQVVAARNHYRELVDSAGGARRTRSLVLNLRASLAHWQGEAGDPVGATAALDELLRETPPRYKKFRLKLRRAHARWRADAGDPVGALTEIGPLVNEFRRTFGPRHRETLYARNLHARCIANAGDPNGAAAQMEPLVNDFHRVLDAEDPDTISARNNLAAMYAQAGAHSRAVPMFTELLDILVRVLGANHPKTLRTRNNLARCGIEAGELRAVIPDIQQLVGDCDRLLGPVHPETLRAWSNLAHSLAKAGNAYR